MKSIIEKSGLGLKGFSLKFEIPYNTVRQWYNGERNAPQWAKNLIEEKLNYKPLLDEYKEPDLVIYEYYTNENLKYRAHLHRDKQEEENIDWFNKCQKKFKDGEEGLNKKIIYKGYKVIDK